MTKVGLYALGKPTTLESNQRLHGEKLTRFGVEELVQMRHNRHG